MNSQQSQDLQAAQTNRALGVFMLFFGVVVIIALFFTDTAVGKLTNLVAGSLLSAIGAGMILKSRRRK